MASTPRTTFPAAHSMIRPCCSRSTSGTRTSRPASFRDGALVATRRAARHARATPTSSSCSSTACSGSTTRPFADVVRDRRGSVVPGPDRGARGRRRAPRAAAARRRRRAPCRSRSGSTGRHEVGADRLVNALAAARLHGTPAVVVDFGTATTFDCVGRGRRVRRRGDRARASSSGSRRSRRGPRSCRGSSCARRTGRSAATRSSAMQCGHGLRLPGARVGPARPGPRASWPTRRASRPADVRAILTGGLSAAPWARGLDGVDAIDPDLTLKGLAILHARGRRRPAARARA